MLGVDYQFIHCKVKKCRYNERSVTRDGRTNKIVQVDYDCTKERIHVDENGKCKDMKIK